MKPFNLPLFIVIWVFIQNCHPVYAVESVIRVDDCVTSNGVPTCCIGLNTTTHRKKKSHQTCTVTRVYIPSEYERNHSIAAQQLNRARRPEIRAFIGSENEMHGAEVWMRRVLARMAGETTETADDFTFLSRFKVTRSCQDGEVEEYLEWIEPLTIQTRRPCSFNAGINLPYCAMESADFLLLQTAAALDKASSGARKTYILDAGASTTWQASTAWFHCAYASQGIHTDQLFSWEFVVASPPSVWWSSVPPHVYPRVHFFNVPITHKEGHPDNPLELIRRVARREDFVAFKLDIDTPSIEIPLALQLLRDQDLLGLVDEFFFELHYKSAVMERYWHDVPNEYDGLVLDVVHALELFTKLREAGVRAHFWP